MNQKPTVLATVQSDGCPDYDNENDTEHCKLEVRNDGSVLVHTDRDWTPAYFSRETMREICKTLAGPLCGKCSKLIVYDGRGYARITLSRPFATVKEFSYHIGCEPDVG